MIEHYYGDLIFLLFVTAIVYVVGHQLFKFVGRGSPYRCVHGKYVFGWVMAACLFASFSLPLAGPVSQGPIGMYYLALLCGWAIGSIHVGIVLLFVRSKLEKVDSEEKTKPELAGLVLGIVGMLTQGLPSPFGLVLCVEHLRDPQRDPALRKHDRGGLVLCSIGCIALLINICLICEFATIEYLLFIFPYLICLSVWIRYRATLARKLPAMPH